MDYTQHKPESFCDEIHQKLNDLCILANSVDREATFANRFFEYNTKNEDSEIPVNPEAGESDRIMNSLEYTMSVLRSANATLSKFNKRMVGYDFSSISPTDGSEKVSYTS